MDISNVVERIKLENYTLYPEGTKRDPFSDPDEELTQKAYAKYCESWNKSEGSRKFVKHLIGSYIYSEATQIESFSEEDKMNGNNHCCMLGIRVAGTEDIKSAWQKALEVAGDSEKKFYWITKKFPIEIKNSSYAWKSEKSSKILSREAYTALEHFVDRCKAEGEKEVIEIFRPKKQGKKKKFVSDKKPSKNSFGALFGEEFWSKLKNGK